MFSILKPKHTLESTITHLIEGLRSGDIKLPYGEKQSNPNNNVIISPEEIINFTDIEANEIIAEVKAITSMAFELALHASEEDAKNEEIASVSIAARKIASQYLDKSALIIDEVHRVKNNLSKNDISSACDDLIEMSKNVRLIAFSAEELKNISFSNLPNSTELSEDIKTGIERIVGRSHDIVEVMKKVSSKFTKQKI